MEDLRGLVNLMRICSRSQSILISYNSSKYHVTVCVVHLWSIRRAIWLWLHSPSLAGFVFCCRIFSAKLFCFCWNTEFTVAASLVLSAQTFFALLSVSSLPLSLCLWFLFTPLLHPLSFCLCMSARKSTVGDQYLTIWQNHIFFLFLSKFNLVLNIPVALIRCPR